MIASIEQLIRGQHFYAGIRIASGLLGLAVLVYFLAGISLAAAVITGALCTSMADVSSPVGHKTRELVAAWLFSSAVYLFITYMRSMPEVLGLCIILLSFMIAMTGVYGTKLSPVSFAGTFAIILGLGSPQHSSGQLLVYCGYFTFGGFAYLVYGIIAARILVYRTKLQLFAEGTFALAQYLRIKASFYEKDADFEKLYPELVRSQANIVNKQQAARDLIFRDIKTSRDIRLASLFIKEVDLFEYLLASNTDYELLQKHYNGHDLMMFLRDIAYKSSKVLEGIAYTALRNAPVPHDVNYKAEVFAVEYDLARMRFDEQQDPAALTALVDTFEKIVRCTEKIDEIKQIIVNPDYDWDPTVSVKLSLFTTVVQYRFRLLLENVDLKSPYFRYALRATIAMGLGYAIAYVMNKFLPGSSGYWILLTISVVLRSNFSMTVQRRTDRIIGNTLGCLLMAVVFYISPPVMALLALWYVAQVAVNTFATINYRYTAACASVLALIQIHFLNPSMGFIFGERILDTVIGALLAWLCSFIFPSWEYRGLPQLAQKLVTATANYTQAVLVRPTMDEQYRLARKNFNDAIAELSGAFDRMLREPKTKRMAVGAIGRFITLNFLLAARIASIRALLIGLVEHPGPYTASYKAAEDKIVTLYHLMDAYMQHPATDRCFMHELHHDAQAVPAIAQSDSAEEIFHAHADPLAVPLHQMAYSQKHVLTLLHKQLDSALLLAGQIHNLEIENKF